jgi:mono/diheme cytochrome c family protein
MPRKSVAAALTRSNISWISLALAMLATGALLWTIATARFSSAWADEKPMSVAPPGFDYWQPEWMVRELWGPGRMPKGMMVRLLRHTTFVHMGVPKEYEGATAPAEGRPEAIKRGAAKFAEQCARCHGPNGMGNGDQGNALTPSPALLAYMIRKPISVDEYLLWTISDGGKSFDSAMPAFRDTLTRDEIWDIVAYMRAGFPKL